MAQTNTVVFTNTPPRARSLDIDGYAAKVNDRIITIGEVREAMAPLIPELYQRFQGAALDQQLELAFKDVRDELISQALIIESFEAQGGQIPDQYINDEIKRVINERFKGDEALFEQLLADQKKTRAEYRQSIRDQMVVGMMTNQEVTRRTRTTPAKVRQVYEDNKEDYLIPEQVKYSVIMLNKGETPEEEAVKLQEAESLREKLLNGADFAETARESSEGNRASEGGQFSWMQPGEAPEGLQQTLETLPAGEISELVDTGAQLYIVKLEARRQKAYKPFEDVREEIEQNLIAQERTRLHASWLERLRKNNYVVVYEY